MKVYSSNNICSEQVIFLDQQEVDNNSEISRAHKDRQVQ